MSNVTYVRQEAAGYRGYNVEPRASPAKRRPVRRPRHGGLYAAVLPRLCAVKGCSAGHMDLGYVAVGVLVDCGSRLSYELRGLPPTPRLWPPP